MEDSGKYQRKTLLISGPEFATVGVLYHFRTTLSKPKICLCAVKVRFPQLSKGETKENQQVCLNCRT